MRVPVFLHVYLSIILSTSLHLCLSDLLMCLSFNTAVCLSVCMYVWKPACLCDCLVSVCLSTWLCSYLCISIYIFVCTFLYIRLQVCTHAILSGFFPQFAGFSASLYTSLAVHLSVSMNAGKSIHRHISLLLGFVCKVVFYSVCPYILRIRLSEYLSAGMPMSICVYLSICLITSLSNKQIHREMDTTDLQTDIYACRQTYNADGEID